MNILEIPQPTPLVIPPCPNPVSPEGFTRQPESYTSIEHSTWAALTKRQLELLEGKICAEYFEGYRKLAIPQKRVPRITELSDNLQRVSHFGLRCVGGLISSETFFQCLARREFTVGWFVRTPEQMDYLPEPDLFHDIFGHVPLLTNRYYANFMQKVGILGLQLFERFKDNPQKATIMGNALLRLYWFTVEFGLMRPKDSENEDSTLCVYGAGIASSFKEVEHSLYGDNIVRIKLTDIGRVVRTKYSIDEVQRLYFVIESFEQLYQMFEGPDILERIVAAREQPMYEKNVVLETDELL